MHARMHTCSHTNPPAHTHRNDVSDFDACKLRAGVHICHIRSTQAQTDAAWVGQRIEMFKLALVYVTLVYQVKDLVLQITLCGSIF
jgi:hypothetical protein